MCTTYRIGSTCQTKKTSQPNTGPRLTRRHDEANCQPALTAGPKHTLRQAKKKSAWPTEQLRNCSVGPRHCTLNTPSPDCREQMETKEHRPPGRNSPTGVHSPGSELDEELDAGEIEAGAVARPDEDLEGNEASPAPRPLPFGWRRQVRPRAPRVCA